MVAEEVVRTTPNLEVGLEIQANLVPRVAKPGEKFPVSNTLRECKCKRREIDGEGHSEGTKKSWIAKGGEEEAKEGRVRG